MICNRREFECGCVEWMEYNGYWWETLSYKCNKHEV
jgi:hypothetical protein